MTVTAQAGVSGHVVAAPLLADGTPSKATLSTVSFVSSDSTIFTVTGDPANPNGGLVALVAAGTATLTATATAAEPDGTTTESITGTATIVVTAVVSPVAASLGLTFDFGTVTP